MEARVNKYNLNELLNDAVANLLIGMLAAIVRLAFAPFQHSGIRSLEFT